MVMIVSDAENGGDCGGIDGDIGSDDNRVLKCDIIKNQICIRIFWKNNIQEAYLPKTSPVGQIVSEILVQLMLGWLHTNPSKFDLGRNI